VMQLQRLISSGKRHAEVMAQAAHEDPDGSLASSSNDSHHANLVPNCNRHRPGSGRRILSNGNRDSM
jgi:hypothetical protein